MNKHFVIAVIEDDESIRESIQDALETEGYGVKAFQNGKLALAGIQTEPRPSLILLDLMMPVMDGWEFMEAKKHLPAAYSLIPVFVVSAVVDQRRIEAAGAKGYIKKPLDLDKLLSVAEKSRQEGLQS